MRVGKGVCAPFAARCCGSVADEARHAWLWAAAGRVRGEEPGRHQLLLLLLLPADDHALTGLLLLLLLPPPPPPPPQDPVADGPLLWIAEEAICAPLPAGWEEEERPDGTATYRHESGQISEHHPLEEHYRAVVAGLRERPSTPSARAPPRGADDATEVVPPTPDEVRAMAEFLGVDPLDEFPLLSLAYEAVAAPLPGRWVELACEDEAQYFEKDTANLRTTHPADSAIFDELERSRSAARAHTRAADDAAAAAAGRSLATEGGERVRDEAAYWMHFHDVHGRGYYYNWLTGRQLSHGPEQQNIAAHRIQAAWRRCRWRCGSI